MEPALDQWLARHVQQDHNWLLERLRSLDNCLDNILYFGEVCSDMRGFGGLRLRCQELQEVLSAHIPEEEKFFTFLAGRREVRPLLATLVEEHRSHERILADILETLNALRRGDPLPEDLFSLQERVRTLSAALRQHINTENARVLPLVRAA